MDLFDRIEPAGPQPPPWVLVAGGFHPRGGMDRANAELARYLAAHGHPVHLVGHQIDPEIAALPGVVAHRVRRPAGSILLGEAGLDRAGRRVAVAVSTADPETRVVVNGGNCAWPDVVWVHAVHAAWPPADRGAPHWFRAKNRLAKAAARRRERRIVPRARWVIANSLSTARHLVERLEVDAGRIEVVYLGSDPAWVPATPAERAAARSWLAVPDDRPVVAFVGALGHDANKGFDTLLAAWRQVCSRPGWDAVLVAAGGGRGLERWRQRVADSGLAERVRLLGFTDRVGELLAASDLLVSPSRYEAYGLNVHEAVARGLPALVSAEAGIAERFGPGLADALLPDPEDAADLAQRLLAWRADPAALARRFEPLAATLRAWSWSDMASRLAAAAGASASPASRRATGATV
jgi:glycosyltransferase involved in cell wall biosynthesis